MKLTLEHERFDRKLRKWRFERAWTAEVLYADRQTVVTRSAGSEQLFNLDGTGSMTGYRKTHPAVKALAILPDRWGRDHVYGLRISARSLARLRGLVRSKVFIARKR